MTDNNVQPGSSQALPDGAIPAATLVIMRPCESGGADEILMVKRSRTMAFAAGEVVFPGGRSDPDDYRGAAEHGFAPDTAEAAARVAVRKSTRLNTSHQCAYSMACADAKLNKIHKRKLTSTHGENH